MATMLLLTVFIKLTLVMCNECNRVRETGTASLTHVIMHSNEDVIATRERYQFAEMLVHIYYFALPNVKTKVTCAFIVRTLLFCLSPFSYADRYGENETTKIRDMICWFYCSSTRVLYHFDFHC